eukprot:gene36502-44282_t
MSNNWVVILVTSRYWNNYRHEANGFIIYNLARRFGVPDDRIIFMDAIDVLNSPRNSFKGAVFVEEEVNPEGNLVPLDGAEVDYRGEDVTLESFKHVVLSEQSSSISPVLDSNEESDVFIYFAGHGGDGFFKFHDLQELDATEFGDLINRLHAQRKYRQLLIMFDTCQAASMGAFITAPSVTFLASSQVGENSYALHVNPTLGVATVDRFSYALHRFLSAPSSSAPRQKATKSLAALLQQLSPSFLFSTPYLLQTAGALPPELLDLRHFLGAGSRQKTYTQDKHAVLDILRRISDVESVFPVSEGVFGDKAEFLPVEALRVSASAPSFSLILLLFACIPWSVFLIKLCVARRQVNR